MKRFLKSVIGVVLVVALMMGLATTVLAAETGYSAASAINVTFGNTYQKNWNSDNDNKPHYVKFSTYANGIVTVRYERPTDSEGEELNLEFYLYDSAGSLVWEAETDVCNPISPYLELRIALRAGTYYLNTEPDFYVTKGTISCDYSLYFTEHAYTEIEQNDSESTATQINTNVVYTGHIGEYIGNRDYFKFYCSTNQKVIVAVSDWDALEAAMYIDLTFYDSYGNRELLPSYELTNYGNGYYGAEVNATPGYNYVRLSGDDVQMQYYIKVSTSGSRPGNENTQKNGWIYESGKWYYYRNNVKQTGWLQEGSTWYYLNSYGQMVTGEYTIGGKVHRFNGSGVWLGEAQKNGWVLESGKWYYYRNDVKQTGWLQEGSTWYYLNANGQMVTGEYTIGGKLHKFNGSGVWLGEAQKNGWVLESGKWFYYKNDVKQTGWLQEGSTWYYLDSNGQMVTGEHTIGTAVHKFNGSGVWLGEVKPEQPEIQKNGWVQESGKWYYYQNGATVKGWKQIGGVWYYLKSDGVMATGWVQVGGTWYYLQSSGAMKTGWLQLGGVWYYLDPVSGAMVTGSRTIGTKTYNFNASGACLNP